MDGGVINKCVPCVVAVFKGGVVGSVGVGLFDAVALFLSLADLRLEVVAALRVAFIFSLELVEGVLVGVLVLGVGGVGGDELVESG
ncbi:hypothetical protein ACUH89_06985 [Dermabacteraceae bacterium P13264]